MIENALVNAGLQKEQVDWLVMHQANQRIMDAAAERLGLPPGISESHYGGPAQSLSYDIFFLLAERVVSNLSEYGNTSAASIPLALDGAVRDGSIKKGDVVRIDLMNIKTNLPTIQSLLRCYINRSPLLI